MAPVTIFIDTSSLPRGLNRLTPDVERLIELAEADLVRIHISVVAVREWESQIVKEFVKCIEAGMCQ